MHLADFLREKFRDGIQHEDAAQLCMSIYCINNILPDGVIDEELTMDRIAEAFAELAKRGLIKNYASYKSVSYGANYHSIDDKGHWIEVQASILKLKTAYDAERCRVLLTTA